MMMASSTATSASLAAPASVTSTQQQIVQKLVADLRSKNEEIRHRAAKDLFNYVSVDLREIPADNLNAVLDYITKHMLDTVKGDASAKLGGVLAIVALINALDLIDVCKTDTRISRFGNFLCNTCLANATDPAVIEMSAKALARLTQVSGTYTATLKLQLIAHEVKRAFEVLQGDAPPGSGGGQGSSQVDSSGRPPPGGSDLQRGDMRRYAAILVLREIASCMPTFFFQNVGTFFDVIFNPIKDGRPTIRESAVYALRAALIVTTQRETAKQKKHQHLSWYRQCFDTAVSSLAEIEGPSGGVGGRLREDKIHGALLIMAELLRCANADWERTSRELEEIIPFNNRSSMGTTTASFESSSANSSDGNAGGGGNGSAASSSSSGFSLTDKSGIISIKGAMLRRYYQTGLSRHSPSSSSGGATPLPFNWFGSVPVGREQIVESALLRQMLTDFYDKVCQFVLDIAHSKDNSLCRNAFIQKALLLVLPKMAAFQREIFVSKFLKSTMSYMDKLLQGKDPSNAYITIGLLSVATGPEIQPYLKNVLSHIKHCLPPSKEMNSSKKKVIIDPSVFACISMLACAVKQGIKHEVSSMLDSMLSTGLSPALTTALYKLALYIPAFKKEIAEGLLKILSQILMQQPYRHPGTPKHLISPSSAHHSKTINNLALSSHGNSELADTASIVLGLRTLGTFDFEGHSLLQFVRHCADNYLQIEEKLIRLEAVRTCSALLKGTLLGLVGRKSSAVQSTVNEVLAKLLVVGITDLDPDIRYCVMSCLDDVFDLHLAQAENLSALFVALNDEQFEIRELTMCIIGRLSILNPAYIMPSLRNTLLQLLTELDRSGIGRNKEQSARILGVLVANSPTLIRPYVEPIVSVLIPKLKETDSNPMVVTSVLSAIGDLAQVGGTLMAKYVKDLLPILLEILNDASSSQKREVSLWTLAQLVESTGAVVTPYSKYPNLLDTLLGFLRTEQRPAIRGQTLRLLGLLGALDPYKHKMNTGQIDTESFQLAPLIPINDSTSEMEQSYEMSPSEMLVNMGTGGTLDDFYPSVAIATLIKIIRDPTLSRHHTEVVKAVTFIFKALGIKSVPYIAQVIPSMLNVIRSSEDTFRDFLFQQLGSLISIVRQHVRNYLDSIFDLIMEFWSVDSPLQPTIILLVENISTALGSEFKIYLPQLIPQILHVLMHDTSRDRHVTGKLLTAIQKFGNTLSDYLHLFLPPMVKLFDSAEVPTEIRKQALETIERLTEVLDFSEFASRIIHPLVRCLETTPELRMTAMDTLSALVYQLGKKYLIFVPMVHKILLKYKISHQGYDLLCARIKQDGTLSDFEDGGGMMRFPRRGGHKGHSVNGLNLRNFEPPEPQLSADGGSQTKRKLPVSTDDLRKAWAVSRRISKDDWLEWYGGLCREFLKASPSPALRACWTVAQRYAQLAKDLFNASFVSCWTELDANQQDELMSSLEKALTEPDLPEISQTILNLAEFMEHCDKGPLPLSPVLLGEQAIKCRAFAKALHYKEDDFHRKPTVPVLEALISVNNKLGQKEAAAGLLQWGNKNLQGELKGKEHWYEKLNDWEKALEVYKKQALQAPKNDPDLILKKMRCLENLGEWGQVHDVAEENWENVSQEVRYRMARMASAAAWYKQDWKFMSRATSFLPRESQDGAFYRAVLCVHQEKWNEAQKLIDLTRDMLDTELTALSLESYQRAYPSMVCVQMLAELEEVIAFKLVPERRETIKEMWWQRLQGCQRVVDDWQRILMVRSMVIKPQEDERTWLKYASLCRKSGRLHLSHKTLVAILGCDPAVAGGGKNNGNQIQSHEQLMFAIPSSSNHPQATLAYCKHLWDSNGKHERDRSLASLQLFVRKELQPKCALLSQEANAARHAAASQQNQPTLAASNSTSTSNSAASAAASSSMAVASNASSSSSAMTMLTQTANEALFSEEKECRQLLARCYLKLGQWQESLHGLNEATIPVVLQCYEESTVYDSNWYKAWHSWAVMNFEACLFHRHQQQQLSSNQQPGNDNASKNAGGILSPQMISKYAVPALKGFVRSITLSKGNSLQDTLRLLTLLFDYGHQSDMYEALHEGIRTIEIDNWLQVIPQLIARIDTPRPLVSRLIHQLLADLGKHHPQALVYSLTVACKSNNAARRNAANKILNKIREHSEVLVNQALMVSDELIRVAILWHEQWHEALEEASRLYFGDRNIQGMLSKLEPLHAMLEKGPQTLKETSFHQAYGNDLNEAKRWCSRYKMSANIRDLNQAWDLYYHVFRRISRQLPQLTQLELQYVSPKLLMCRSLELAVPGSYTPLGLINQISSVEPSLQVITSKQRPRKLSIRGSNGRTYMFLLKGHEDLRQDERVMQFFSLVNSLLVNDPETLRRNLAIQRFAVIPLSTNSGLIGWVPHSDTLHGLIKDYRDKKKIVLNLEHRLMQRMAPDYDHLPLMKKVEVFEHSLELTQGDDLAKLLLLKSPSSEDWFDRRTNFTRSLAVMSMVGYVLGLGDRHPSNLLLDRMSGKILHIDFGDCFEVAMTREKFPEKIPFRLTRMLINAMEVTGIEGTYRSTCESVMAVLRNNKDSLMAVLEAFVYDPLLNWRLIETGNKSKKTKATTGATIDAAAAAAPGGGGEPKPGAAEAEGSANLLDVNPLTGGDQMVPSENRLTGEPSSGHESATLVGSGSGTGTGGGAASTSTLQQQQQQPEALNKKALDIVQRVRDKLTGRDFDANECLAVADQVDLLIRQATNNENLCQCYIGWCPFW